MRRLPISLRNVVVLGTLAGLLTLLAFSPTLVSAAQGGSQSITGCQAVDLSLKVSGHVHTTAQYRVGDCESVTLSSEALPAPINLQICYGSQHKEWCGSPFGRDSWICVPSGAPYTIAYLQAGTAYHLRYKTCSSSSASFSMIFHLMY